MSVMEEIAAERRRQQEVEGWTTKHDDQHSQGEMLDAARCYLSGDPTSWPWETNWWKPKDRRRDLIRAGALAEAEIARIERFMKATPWARVLVRRSPKPRDEHPKARSLRGATDLRGQIVAEIERLDRAEALSLQLSQ